MKRRYAAVLSLVSAFALLGGVCAPPNSNEVPDGGGGGGGITFGPFDATKRVVSVTAKPGLIIETDDPVTLDVTAVVLFNSQLIPSSVMLLDATPGGGSFPPTPMTPAGVSPQGQLFTASAVVDASELGTIVLRASAAYQNDPRRASLTADVPVVEDPVIPVSDPLNIVSTSAGTFDVTQIIADLVGGVSRAVAEDLAAHPDVDGVIVGFEPVTNIYVIELPAPGPAGPDAFELLDTALAFLVSNPDLVEAAFPNTVIGNETTDIVAKGLDAAYVAANIPAAWAELQNVVDNNAAITGLTPVKVGLFAAGIEVGNLAGTIAPHPELTYLSGGVCQFFTAACPVYVPTVADRNTINGQLSRTRENPCDDASADAIDCPLERERVDHGTYLAGVLGAVNEAGTAAGLPAGDTTSGVLAFDTGTVTGGPNAVTGSELPYQVLFASGTNDGTPGTFAAMVGSITKLRDAGADVILLPLGWHRAEDSGGNPLQDANGMLVDTVCADANTLSAAVFDGHKVSLTGGSGAITLSPNVLFVASAGNCNADAQYHLPGGIDPAPVNLLSVMATDNAGTKAGFSNFGTSVHVGAPGVGVPGPIGYHDAVAPNTRVLANTGAANTANADIAEGSGTSAAAALAAGIAALERSVAPTTSVEDWRDGLAAGGTLGMVPGSATRRIDAFARVSTGDREEVDVAIIVDSTGSFSGAIDQFRQQANSLLNVLSNCGADVAVSLAEFKDFDISPFGSPGDFPFQRLFVPGKSSPTQLVPSAALAEDNVDEIVATLNAPNLVASGGNDHPESQNEALFQIATGQGLAPFVPAGHGGDVGANAAFRSGTSGRRIVVLWTDAPFHDPADPNDADRNGGFGPGAAPPAPAYPAGAATAAGARTAVANAGAKVITIRAGSDAFLISDATLLANATNSFAEEIVDCLGDGIGGADDLAVNDPLICQIGIDGAGIANALVATLEGAGANLACP